jgi:hypothetical protein
MISIFSFPCRFTLFSGLSILPGGHASAHFRKPVPIPTNRPLKSAMSYLLKHPDDPEAHYTLARIHYLAFHLGSNSAASRGHPDDKRTHPGKPTWAA